MDYSKMTIEVLKREEEKLRTKYKAIEDECIKKGLSFNEFQEMAHDEAEGLYLISKYRRLKQDPVVQYGKEWKGDLYTLEEFKKMAMDGDLIDSDGSGLYATDTSVSDVEVVPSDVVEGLIREDFSHIMWFNK